MVTDAALAIGYRTVGPFSPLVVALLQPTLSDTSKRMDERKRSANGEDENEQWILDSLVMYLRGPIWNMPILNFIEEKSVIFESSEDLENEYRRIHDEFRNLVDAMLGAYMDDLCLQPENLELALSQIQPSVRSAALQELLEPVQSAGDYQKFKELMRSKNEELHKQAMELLIEQGKAHPSPHSNSIEDSYEDRDLKEAIRLSIAEQEAVQKDTRSEEHDVERALAISLAGLLTEVARDQQDPSDSATAASSSRPTSTTAINTNHQMKEDQRDARPDPAEVERRRKLLREQRDKIISRKRQERELQMQLHEKQVGSGSRPKSGSVARAALAGETAQKVDDKTLQYRRLLLQKIQEEVKNPEKS